MQDATLIAFHEVVQKFGYSGNQQMISGTGDVEQVPLGVVDLLQIGIVADRLDAFLQGNYFVVAGDHDPGPKFQPFGEVHGADRDVPVGGFDVFIENLKARPASMTAARARSSCAADRTNTPISCGSTPALARFAIQLPTNVVSSLSLLSE